MYAKVNTSTGDAQAMVAFDHVQCDADSSVALADQACLPVCLPAHKQVMPGSLVVRDWENSTLGIRLLNVTITCLDQPWSSVQDGTSLAIVNSTMASQLPVPCIVHPCHSAEVGTATAMHLKKCVTHVGGVALVPCQRSVIQTFCTER
jgi:hypothetical protein